MLIRPALKAIKGVMSPGSWFVPWFVEGSIAPSRRDHTHIHIHPSNTAAKSQVTSRLIIVTRHHHQHCPPPNTCPRYQSLLALPSSTSARLSLTPRNPAPTRKHRPAQPSPAPRSSSIRAAAAPPLPSPAQLHNSNQTNSRPTSTAFIHCNVLSA